MLVIGERINGMFTDVGQAIVSKDAAVIRDLAEKQVAAGARVLDCNTGAAAEDRVAAMQWLCQTIREVTDMPIAVDTMNRDVLKAGLDVAGPTAFINSTKGSADMLDNRMAMAAEYGCKIVALTMDEKGVPRDADGRMEVVAKIVESAMMNGVDFTDLYIDPIIIPANVPDAGHYPTEVLKTIEMIKQFGDPAPRTTLGLSNVSQGTSERSLINRTYVVMAVAAGLDSAIMDPLDTELMDAMITTELLLNRMIYCDDFLRAYRMSM